MIRIGIIGCGKIAQTRHIPEYMESPNTKLVAFYDLNTERAVKLAQQFDAKAYPTVEALLVEPEIEAVSVCTANQSHASITVKALQAGKHVLCEKPMATTLADCQAMVNAAQQSGRYLMIDHNQRLAQAHVYAKNMIQQGCIGRIITFRTTFGHGGPETWSIDPGSNVWFFDKSKAQMGAMGDLGVHKTDLIQFLCGASVAKTTARLSTLEKKYSDGSPIGVDDNAVCIYELENGVIGTMTASWTYFGEEDNSTILYGTEGILRIYDDPLHAIVLIHKDGTKEYFDVEAIQTNDSQTKSGVIDYWMQSLTQHTPPEISGQSALHAMKAVFASLESSKTGKTVCIK